MDTSLPSDLQAGLDGLLSGVSRRALSERAAAISDAYRSGRGSATSIKCSDDALAYALARLPATYAAAASVLAELARVAPGFAPRTVLDVGAGPGTASWAAVERFPDVNEARLIDENEHFRALALRLLPHSSVQALRDAMYQKGDATALLGSSEPAELVIASYFIGEATDDRFARIASLLWSRTNGILVIVEPGTPAGYRHILAVRSHLIGEGGHVVCPCPHDLACPLAGDDWCHFSQRLSRSRDHRQVKAASLPFEDEKFSYVALSRCKSALPPKDRVLISPQVSKAAITAKLCTSAGLLIEQISRRDRSAYKTRKSWRWGDAVSR